VKVSIITVVFNGVKTINDTIQSVLGQKHPYIEYIIIDGASTDGTVKIIQNYINSISLFVSVSDSGIYDAMNKGLKLATGDIVGILNSDDIYVDSKVISEVVNIFVSKQTECVFADLVYVHPDNLGYVVRYYSAAGFTPDKFAYGWMPPHPTFFARREVYEKYGLFNTTYKIAADFELLVRFLARHKVSYFYLPEVIVKMRTGGISTRSLKSNFILNKEIVKACKENNISTNYLKVYSKYLTKVSQLIRKSKWRS